MLVRDWMSKNVVTIEASEPMQQAINLLMEHHIGMLPVIEEGKLVGIVFGRILVGTNLHGAPGYGRNYQF